MAELMLPSLFDLSEKVALVTCGNKGLGKAMARGFAEAGASVTLASRSAGELEHTASEIRAASGAKVEYCVADMVDRKQVDNLARTALERMGRVDILVNNAGSNTPRSTEAIRDEDWDRIIEMNLSSCMRLTRLRCRK